MPLIASIVNPKSDQYQAAERRRQERGDAFSEAMFFFELAGPLEEKLKQFPEFSEGVGFFVNGGNAGYWGLYAGEAARGLVEQALDRGATEAVEWLAKVLKTRTATGHWVALMWGLRVETEIELPGAIRLLPVALLPSSRKLRYVQRGFGANLSSFGTRAPSPPPLTALMLPTTVDPFLWPTKGREPPRHDVPIPYQTLFDAALALTVVSVHPTIIAASWFQYDDPDLDAAAGGGIHSQGSDVLPFMFQQGDLLEDVEVAAEVVASFQGMPKTLHERVRIALHRFNQALRRTNSGDTAADLAIALEALTMDSPGDNNHKVGLRVALMLGGTLEERVATRATTTALYDVRSQVMHKGQTRTKTTLKGSGKVPTGDVVRMGRDVVRRFLVQVLRNRGIPDWYRYELQRPQA